LSFKTWKSDFTNVRFRSWSSKPLSVNAALVCFILLPPYPPVTKKDGGFLSEGSVVRTRL